jgi:hypothetical protein
VPADQELRFGVFEACRPPARGDAQLGVDVHSDGPVPPQLRPAVPVLVLAPHVAAVLDNDVVEPVSVAGDDRPVGRNVSIDTPPSMPDHRAVSYV